MITVPYITWFLTHTDPQHPGRVVAYAMQADYSGGHRLPGEHVGDTIEQARTMAAWYSAGRLICRMSRAVRFLTTGYQPGGKLIQGC